MKKSLILPTLALAFLTLFTQGCANKLSYSDANVSFNGTGSGKLAIATHDQRPYIANGDKTPDFVGLVRGGYGNPFDMTTQSGNSLAEEMTQALAASFQKSGFVTTPVLVSPSDNDQQVIGKIFNGQTNRAVVLLLQEWKSDTYASTSLRYDLTLRVLDGSARVMAEKQMNGNDNLGGGLMNAYSHVNAAVPQAFKAKLEQLINSPEIQRALVASIRSTVAVDTPHVDQAAARTGQSTQYMGASERARQFEGDAVTSGNQDPGKMDTGDIESRLEKLKRLFERELISEDEYYRERKRVLGSM
jgi:hypothetical protein